MQETPIAGGIKVMKSEMLPNNTIMVSPDLFEIMKMTPEEKTKRTEEDYKRITDFMATLNLN